MSRIINPDGVGKERKHLSRAVVLAIRELMLQSTTDDNIYDPAAFIVLALDMLSKGIDRTVIPWEKRGYWLKADKFRLEWEWSSQLGNDMRDAVLNEDLVGVAVSAAKIGEKLSKVEVPKRHRLGIPWEGAWEQLKLQFGKTK